MVLNMTLHSLCKIIQSDEGMLYSCDIKSCTATRFTGCHINEFVKWLLVQTYLYPRTLMVFASGSKLPEVDISDLCAH